MTGETRWAFVRPVRRLPRPVGYWARFGQLEPTGYGGRLCSDARHPVYLAERGEPNRQGERERFHCCAICMPSEEEEG